MRNSCRCAHILAANSDCAAFRNRYGVGSSLILRVRSNYCCSTLESLNCIKIHAPALEGEALIFIRSRHSIKCCYFFIAELSDNIVELVNECYIECLSFICCEYRCVSYICESSSCVSSLVRNELAVYFPTNKLSVCSRSCGEGVFLLISNLLSCACCSRAVKSCCSLIGSINSDHNACCRDNLTLFNYIVASCAYRIACVAVFAASCFLSINACFDFANMVVLINRSLLLSNDYNITICAVRTCC